MEVCYLINIEEPFQAYSMREVTRKERDQVKWGELKITVAMWDEEGEDIFCSLVPRISPGQTGL